MEKELKKVSAFEFAIMQIAQPERAKEYRAYTREEQTQRRIGKLKTDASKMKVIPNKKTS
jgi:hypothetical protein